MSHILIISRYYPPEICVAGVCVSETATRLVKLGHQVTVLTTVPNYPTGIVPPAYRGRLIQSEMIEGVRVVRTWCYIAPNTGFLRRVIAQLSFGLLAPLLGWGRIGRPDVIIVGSPPLFNVIAGRALARLKRCPLIFMVADLWPESAVQLGALRNRAFIRLAEWLEWSSYQRASLVWIVTARWYETLIQRGLDPKRVFLLNNGVDCAKFRPQSRDQARAELGWDDRYTVLYTGGHGMSHNLDMVLDAAEQLRDRPEMRFVLVGEGDKKARLMEDARQRGLTNVTFVDAQPHQRIPIFIAASDASLVLVRNVPLFQGMMPIKMYEAMACGRPVLLAMEGEARQVAEQEAGAAIHVEPENANSLVSAIDSLHSDPQEAEELGQRGRAYVQEHFDYDLLTARLDTRIAQLLTSRGASTNVASTNVPSTNIS